MLPKAEVGNAIVLVKPVKAEVLDSSVLKRGGTWPQLGCSWVVHISVSAYSSGKTRDTPTRTCNEEEQ